MKSIVLKVDPQKMSSIYYIYRYIMHNQKPESEQKIKFPQNCKFAMAINKQNMLILSENINQLYLL